MSMKTLTTEQIYFLEQNPTARKLIYQAALVDAKRADDMFRFLREAYLRHFPVTLTVEVRGVSCSLNIFFDSDGPGWNLYEFLGGWVAGMSIKDKVMADQMAKIWPDLPGWWSEQAQKTGPQIAPETP
jgi:hypothetical protein